MNRFIADSLAVLNGLIFLLIILASCVFGVGLFNLGQTEMAFLCFVGGIATASLTCGITALLVLIERHLNR